MASGKGFSTELAEKIGAPFNAEAYIASDEAVLRIDRRGQTMTSGR
jgi:hypothetical protein